MSAEVPSSTPPIENNDWMNRPESAELVKWRRETMTPAKEKDMKKIDDLLEQHLGNREFVDSYGNQKAKALHAMKLYIDRAYALCEAEAHKSDVDAAGRALWNERFFKNCEDDVNQYYSMITAFLVEAARKNDKEGPNKGKIDLNVLFDLAERGREIYWEISKEPKYADILRRISTHAKLTPDDYNFIIAKIPPEKTPSEISADASMKLLEASGAITLMYAMNPSERKAFAEHIINTMPADRAIGLITSLGSSGYLTQLQLTDKDDGIFAKMKAKGLVLDENQQKNLESTIEIGQAKAKMIRANIDTGIRADMDKNLAIKFFEPRYIGGFALMAWRGANAALSLIAYRNDLKEYLESPWLIADVGGILAGSALVGNPSVLEWIKGSADAKTLETQAQKLAVCQLVIDKPGVTNTYFVDPMKGKTSENATGMVELISMIREKKETAHEPPNVKIDDMLKIAEGNDAGTKTRIASKPVNPALIALLKEAKAGKNKDELEQYASTVCASKMLKTTELLNQWIDDLKRIEGVKK